jgi:hypothetical protein
VKKYFSRKYFFLHKFFAEFLEKGLFLVSEKAPGLNARGKNIIAGRNSAWCGHPANREVRCQQHSATHYVAESLFTLEA